MAVEHHPLWKGRVSAPGGQDGQAERDERSCRKRLVVMWNVRIHQEVDPFAEVEAVGRTCLQGGEIHRTATHRGLSWAQCTRTQLTAVGLGAELETRVDQGHRYALPAVASGSG